MTHRIYDTEPSCRAFDAVVTRAVEHEGRPAVILDRTAFYPTSGGQPFDTGRLDGVQVLETVDAGEDIVHVLSAPLAYGAAVRGQIDWARRFDHMQQHTGQHMLSAAFDRLFDNRTMSVHMGADAATIDLAKAAPAADVERAVDEANRVVWEDRPVAIRFASPEEAARLALRKEPLREGTLRLIDIDGFDLSACGGTHVDRTGAVGAIAALATERFRGGTRLTFVCGTRVVRHLRAYRDAVAGSVRALSVVPAELPAAVERLQADARDLRKIVKGQQEQLAGHEAARLLAAAQVGRVPRGADDPPPSGPATQIVIEALDGWDAPGLKAIATAATASARAVVVLVGKDALVVARSAGVSTDASAVLRQLTERFGGRGGGKPDLAQGGGLTAAPHEVASAARDILRSVRLESGF
ncbi:MAG: phosphoesterase [Acidimicrobiia bacterium]|nr:phosphoesterase [Acidimicrobiia bacterium]